MAEPRAVVSVDVLREAARAYSERVPLRDFAAEVGIPWSTLRAFMQGAEPRNETRRKLTAWFARTMESRADPLTAELARAFVAGLLSGIPEKRRADAERRVLDFVAELYRQAGARPPG
jgi:hypothetical protein